MGLLVYLTSGLVLQSIISLWALVLRSLYLLDKLLFCYNCTFTIILLINYVTLICKHTLGSFGYCFYSSLRFICRKYGVVTIATSFFRFRWCIIYYLFFSFLVRYLKIYLSVKLDHTSWLTEVIPSAREHAVFSIFMPGELWWEHLIVCNNSQYGYSGANCMFASFFSVLRKRKDDLWLLLCQRSIICMEGKCDWLNFILNP